MVDETKWSGPQGKAQFQRRELPRDANVDASGLHNTTCPNHNAAFHRDLCRFLSFINTIILHSVAINDTVSRRQTRHLEDDLSDTATNILRLSHNLGPNIAL